MIAGATRARGAVGEDRRGRVVGAERDRLRLTFGSLLAAERGARLTQKRLSELSGVSVRTIEDLEGGRARPSVNMIWRLAAGLRVGFDEFAVGAVAIRLEVAAGGSLRYHSRRPHVARDRLRARLLEEFDGRLPVHKADSLAVVTLASMIERMS